MLRVAMVMAMLGTAGPALAQDPAPKEISLTSMIDAVQGALLDSQKSLAKDQMLPLSKVELVLNTINTSEVSGRTGFWMFRADASYSSAVTSRVEMTLTPPPASADDARSPASQIREALGDAIFAGAAARSAAINGSPPLDAQSFVITLEFAVVSDGNAGVALAYPPFSSEISAGLSENRLQKIVMKFD
ncbi:hypothetical protein R5H30_21455 [Sulfitobacter sp. D35]|uniref:trypco2 family protein n=1 Tax=Sulfitobacter sp. D35 TaxID=3083252 RepID=UPI00296FF579|nr:trypco2 family protein [Sulfitobacter sp. D35]MDW4500564.1 hypothetical protein [Sulfitobacter sp. D35]